MSEDDKPEISRLIDEVFNCEMPDDDRCNIVVQRNDAGEIVGFTVVEMVLRVGQIYSKGGEPRRMLNYINKSIPAGTSVIACADESRFDGLCRKYGMREVPGKVFRLDR